MIDADALEKEMDEKCGGECDNCIHDRCPVYNQPTAYDVDAVVEQLEDWHNHYDDGIMVVSEAIDIVRKGGKE